MKIVRLARPSPIYIVSLPASVSKGKNKTKKNKNRLVATNPVELVIRN